MKNILILLLSILTISLATTSCDKENDPQPQANVIDQTQNDSLPYVADGDVIIDSIDIPIANVDHKDDTIYLYKEDGFGRGFNSNQDTMLYLTSYWAMEFNFLENDGYEYNKLDIYNLPQDNINITFESTNYNHGGLVEGVFGTGSNTYIVPERGYGSFHVRVGNGHRGESFTDIYNVEYTLDGVTHNTKLILIHDHDSYPNNG